MEKQISIDINKIIQEVYEGLTNNNFKTLGEPTISMWQQPLIGVAKGDDPYFDFLKEHIGPFHWSPAEAFALRHEEADPCDLRVVSMAFPQSEIAKEEQKKVSAFPCDNWLVSRGEWEPVMQDFSGELVSVLAEKGIKSVSIDLLDEFHLAESANVGVASTWSHRHAAYAAGLGTFGLTDALITEKGTAVRITNIIVKAPLQVTERPYNSPYQWCIHFQDGDRECDLCVKRCPVDAISGEGHDKKVCTDYEDYAIDNMWPKHIERGDYMFGCGICQAAIPCQNRKP